MNRYSFIDNEREDFLRFEDGSVIIIRCFDWHGAEGWLLSNGQNFGWTNTGVRYWCWDEEFPE